MIATIFTDRLDIYHHRVVLALIIMSFLCIALFNSQQYDDVVYQSIMVDEFLITYSIPRKYYLAIYVKTTQ